MPTGMSAHLKKELLNKIGITTRWHPRTIYYHHLDKINPPGYQEGIVFAFFYWFYPDYFIPDRLLFQVKPW